MEESVLRGIVRQYTEHWQKAVRAYGDPSRVYEIRHWIREMRGFAKAIYDECIRIQDHGGKVTSLGDPEDVWDRERVEQRFASRMQNLLDLERENEIVAKQSEL